MTVEKFRGRNFFLSNMYVLENWLETERGILVPTSEHVYQADRFVDEEPHRRVAETERGVEAKTLAHELLEQGAREKPDWQVAKVGKMTIIVTEKFRRNSDLAARLIETDEEELVEGNDWDDTFWGVDPIGSRNGENHLGKILMFVRADLRSGHLVLEANEQNRGEP